MRPSSAFCEIWPPQVGPTKVRLTAESRRFRELASLSWILDPSANETCDVCTDHRDAPLPSGWASVAFGSAAGSTPLTIFSSCEAVACGAENWKMDPPLKSTL